MGNPVSWFEIPVADLKRAREFYSKVFGLEMSDDPAGAMPSIAFFPQDMTQYGVTGGLSLVENHSPVEGGTIIYFSVPDIDATLAAVNAGGGKTALPKTSIAPYGHVARFTDSEGNLLALHTPPETMP